MKVSVNWMKYYSSTGLAFKSVDELVEKIGAQLGAVEEVIDLGKKYQGIIIAKVVSCEKHPNADKLSVCLIDDGGKAKKVKRDSKGLVEVVCGAPNVRAGLLVAWLPPGSTVPNSFDKEPFVLETRELRGIVSNGMLASAHELGISDDHSGIVELDQGKPGDDLAKTYGLDDYIIDIENKMFTHRPDCFGQLGVAREIAGVTHKAFKSPAWYLSAVDTKLETDELPIRVKNGTPKLVPRFTAIAMSNVEIKPSPFWLQTYLSRVGIRPINNVVDLTNYFMVLTGQPLHAYDYDKLPAKSLETRMSKKGETIKLLSGKEIKFEDDQAILITSGDVPVGIGGIMGGADTEVSQDTKNIVLECATFDMYSIRKTSMNYGLFTDAVTRFSKGQSPLQNDKVLAKIVNDLQEIAGAKVASELIDAISELKGSGSVRVSPEFVSERLGMNFSAKKITELLENVEFKVLPVSGKQLAISAPFWRTDIEIPEDIVEEVGRLYGYDKLPQALPKRIITPTERDALLDFKQSLRTLLSAAGANEVLTYSFVHGKLLTSVGQQAKQAFQLSNALSPDLQYYRLSLIPNLLEKVHPNLKSDMVRDLDNDFAVFEIGKAHIKGHNNDEDLPLELERLALVVAADDKTAARKYQGSAFYFAKKYLIEVTNGQAEFKPLDNHNLPVTAPYERGRSAVVLVGDQVVGVIGEFKPSVRAALKLPAFCAGFELDINLVQGQVEPNTYLPIPTFPKTQQDITFEVNAEVNYQDLFNCIWEELRNVQDEHGYLPVLGPRDIFAEEGSNKKRLTFRLWLAHPERTLRTEEVNRLLDHLADVAKSKLSAERI